MSWSLRFAEPIVLEDGVKLKTLREAMCAPGRQCRKPGHGSSYAVNSSFQHQI